MVKKDASLGLYAWNVKELVDVDTQETRWQALHDKRDELEEILLKAERVQPTLAAACAAFLRSAAKDMAVAEETERSESETKRLDCQIVLLRNDIRAALTPTPLKKKKAADHTPLDTGTRTARTLNLGETPLHCAATASVVSPTDNVGGTDARAVETPGSIFGDWVGAGSLCGAVDDETARDELRELSILWSEGSAAGGVEGASGAAGGDGVSVASGGGAPGENHIEGLANGSQLDGEDAAEGVAVMLNSVVRIKELEDALAASRREAMWLKGQEKEHQARRKSLEEALAAAQADLGAQQGEGERLCLELADALASAQGEVTEKTRLLHEREEEVGIQKELVECLRKTVGNLTKQQEDGQRLVRSRDELRLENAELLQKSKGLEGELALVRQQLTFAQVQ